jgi:hypothetical protein
MVRAVRRALERKRAVGGVRAWEGSRRCAREQESNMKHAQVQEARIWCIRAREGGREGSQA